jgi:hypothetical protein
MNCWVIAGSQRMESDRRRRRRNGDGTLGHRSVVKVTRPGPIGTERSRKYHPSNEMNSSTSTPATRRIARKVPRSNPCDPGPPLGHTVGRGETPWLPSCRRNRKPTFPSALAQSRPEMRGSLLTPRLAAYRIALQESAGDLPPTP